MGRDFNMAGRSPFGRHIFVGGNSLMPSILRDNPSLGAKASREAFDATIAAVRDQLRHRTAKIEIGNPALAESRLKFSISIENLVGHKFPSAYPSRRAWLRIRVLDKDGKLCFESGNWNAEGFLTDDKGKVLPSELAGGPIQKHRQTITGSDQVQIYEAIMKDDHGRNTWLLMRAAGYSKDTRILPKGWSAKHAEAKKTAPAGHGDDKDFVGGGDRIQVDVPLEGATGPYEIQVDMLYQSQGSRYLSEFLTAKNPQVRSYEKIWKASDRRPDLVGSAKRIVR